MASASPSSNPNQDSRHRATAIKHALALEEKKTLKSRILDLVLEAYDLPSQQSPTPENASLSDIQLFKTCLSLFQPSDFDNLVRERNIDDRCGYPLCSKPNQKVTGGGNKVWNRKGGQEFKLVDRTELEKWCSQKCTERGGFVRAQLSTEPAWLRESQNDSIKLLDEMPQTDDLTGALQELTITGSAHDDLNTKLKALSLERGDLGSAQTTPIQILEKVPNAGSDRAPVLTESNTIEGFKPRQIRFDADASADPGG